MLEYLEKFNNLPNDIKQKISSGATLAQIEGLEAKYGVPLAAFIVRIMIGDLYYKNITANLIIEYDLDAAKAEELEKILKEKIFSGVMDYLEGGKKESSTMVTPGSVAEKLIDHHFKVETKSIPAASSPVLPVRKEQIPPSLPKNFLEEDKKDITDTGKVIASFKALLPGKNEIMLEEIVKEANISFASADLLKRFKEIVLTYLRNVRTKVEIRENLIKEVYQGGVKMREADVDRVLAIAQKKLSAEENKFLSEPRKISARTTGDGTSFVFSDKDLKEELEEKAKAKKIEEFKKAAAISLGARDVDYDFAALSKKGPVVLPKKIEAVVPSAAGSAGVKKLAPVFPDIDLRKEPVKKINPIAGLIKRIKGLFLPSPRKVQPKLKVGEKETKQAPAALAGAKKTGVVAPAVLNKEIPVAIPKKPEAGPAPVISVLPAASIVGIKPPAAIFPDIDLRKPVLPKVAVKKINPVAKLKEFFSVFLRNLKPKAKAKTVFPDIDLRKPVLPATAAKPAVPAVPAVAAVVAKKVNPVAKFKEFFTTFLRNLKPKAEVKKVAFPDIDLRKPILPKETKTVLPPVVSAPSAVSIAGAKPPVPGLLKIEPVKTEPGKPAISAPAAKPGVVAVAAKPGTATIAATGAVPVAKVMEVRTAAIAGNKKRMEDIKPTPKVMSPIDELAYMDLVIFRRLDTVPAKRVAKIEEKINLLEKEGIDKKIEGIAAWRSNPVSKTYIAMGRESIGDGKNIDDIIKERKDQGLNYLSKEEFEAVLDLNNNLRF